MVPAMYPSEIRLNAHPSSSQGCLTGNATTWSYNETFRCRPRIVSRVSLPPTTMPDKVITSRICPSPRSCEL
jgi:hypothetical protein